jgi:murein DD-endopeptidase MepM/ murein hydrolase activator NlpD
MIRKRLKIYLIWSSLFALFSCSTLKSGHYVQWRKKDTWESLSKEVGVPAWKLRAFNKGRRPANGQWVFIPQKNGMIATNTGVIQNPELYIEKGELSWPVPSSRKISSRFGKRWGKKHEGIDIPARKGTHIVAVNFGVVVHSGKGLGGYGNTTVIAHENGFFSIYAHAQKNYTKRGQKVHKGQVIATVGTSGRSTGPHLHFELRHDSKALDPLKLLSYKP